ncbi:carbamoyltransferase C-terminal domain-containing protein [Streptomyces sp. NPDC006996]|uniref:carbamoyltransferase family protein n=1 Tax=Streptomyces sp. NPDC006996 TaxID=3156908 RepID=UPI00340F5A4D
MLRSHGLSVLGFSGLANSREFKRKRWPELDKRELRIFQGADAAAALVVGGDVRAAAAEERFDGVKHSEAFPIGAARYCLEAAGMTADRLDHVAHSFSYGPESDFYLGQTDYYRDLYEQVLNEDVNRRIAEQQLGVDLTDRFVPVPHHLAHAASAYYPSGYREALVVVSDGLGERHSATVFAANPDCFELIARIPAHSSAGLLYGLFTLYLGFEFGDGEYKVMGLAPYGDPTEYAKVIRDRWVRLDADGTYAVSLLLANVTDLDKETYRGALSELESVLGPRRTPHSDMEQRHMDIAAGLQAVLQSMHMHLIGHHLRVTGLRNLCLAGGVALNCVANGVVLRSRLAEEVFVQPASADDGAALGAALFVSRAKGDAPHATNQTALGPDFSRAQCREAVESVAGLMVDTFDDPNDFVRAVAERLQNGEIGGWFQGRMEFGPRALGNRSILADPRRPEMRERINRLVKKREAFRPFAPVVTVEDAPTYFEIESYDAERFAHMLFVAYARPEFADRLPATTHVDGSARVQTVSRSSDPLFWSLLSAFGDHTGMSVLLNTSFNVQGQPIVRDPGQAVSTFLDAQLNFLAIDQMIVTRAEVSAE